MHSIRFSSNKNSFCEFYLNSNKFDLSHSVMYSGDFFFARFLQCISYFILKISLFLTICTRLLLLLKIYVILLEVSHSHLLTIRLHTLWIFIECLCGCAYGCKCVCVWRIHLSDNIRNICYEMKLLLAVGLVASPVLALFSAFVMCLCVCASLWTVWSIVFRNFFSPFGVWHEKIFDSAK